MAARYGVQFLKMAILLALVASVASDSCNSGKLRIKLEYLERKLLEMKTDIDRNQRRIEQTLEKILENTIEEDTDCPPFESCFDAKQHNLPSGKYLLKLPGKEQKSFIGYCNQKTSEGGWLVIQSRVDGSLSFEKNWESYERGFGQCTGNYWIGLEKLHLLTANQQYELRIELDNEFGIQKYASYDGFVVGSSSELYRLRKLGAFTGTAGDSMSNNVGTSFSTFDRRNNNRSANNCTIEISRGWWLHVCEGLNYSNLNGVHGGASRQAIVWWSFSQSYTGLKCSRMLIRHRRRSNRTPECFGGKSLFPHHESFSTPERVPLRGVHDDFPPARSRWCKTSKKTGPGP
ncbi:AAEL008030-PA [Aedes aegypti]|uniref:AAEL008030-PA n=1 Tax=Aedes aegypti TaxID=7159 RepID=Q16ZX3_AEDAE|nr:AAEL008030-PA [Aedes aegypti]